MEPCHFERQQTAKSNARVEVRSAGLTKLRGHFGEAAHDHPDAHCGHEIGERALTAQIGGDNCGQSEDAAADDRVYDQRREPPSANGSYEVRRFAWAHFCGFSGSAGGLQAYRTYCAARIRWPISSAGFARQAADGISPRGRY